MTERTVLRNILFPDDKVCTVGELYFRTNDNVKYSKSDGFMSVHGAVSFDTYFNIIPVKKYLDYCDMGKVFLEICICGSFSVKVYGVSADSEECVLSENADLDDKGVFTLELSDVFSGKYDNAYFTLEADNGRFYGGKLVSENENIQKVNIAVVICTFRREKFLLENHARICEYVGKSNIFDNGNFHVYIVDNGRTLERDKTENSFVTLIPNENTGGSGGFTRGYYEAVHSGRDFTHILFMDDDIVLDCEMFLRVYSILRIRRSECAGLAVGGTMIKLSDRITQHEAGSFWDGKRHISIGEGCDLTERQTVLDTAYYPEGDYNAWWFYCFPSDWQEKHGYPLQFFIKEDDIEYSLRCAGKIAVIIGIAVWHDDFEGKYDGFQEYYIKRNELIMTAVNDQKRYTLFQIRKLVLSVMRQTVYQRYFLADIIMRAYDDFLRGWEHFYNTDTISLNKELMESCEPLIGDEELLEKYGVYFDKEKYDKACTESENLKKQALTLNGYLIPVIFYKKDKDGFYITDLAKRRIVNFYKHKVVLHYDVSRRKGFVTKQKKSKLWGNIFRLIFKSIRFAIMYPSVCKGFKKNLGKLTGEDIIKRTIK